MTPKEVLAWIRQEAVRAVDLRFMDFPGSWKHFTIPSERLDEASFEDGFGFDASSVRGWQQINESDMLVFRLGGFPSVVVNRLVSDFLVKYLNRLFFPFS